MANPDISELRLALRAAGYAPIPARGKDKLLPGWPLKDSATETEIAAWQSACPDYVNTGVLAAKTPGLDADIRLADAAGAAEDLVRDWFDGRGTILVRFGLSPKRLIPFRTAKPFPKIRVEFDPLPGDKPSDKLPAIEILGDGQQFIVDGIHPDTGKPYWWHADRTLWNVPREELPEIDEAEAHELVALIVEMLVERFGFKVRLPGKANGRAADFPGEPVDAGALLAGLQPSGAAVNEALKHVIPSLLRRGEHPDDVLERVVNAVMAVAKEHGLDQGAKAWTRKVEVECNRRRIQSGYANLLLKGYDPSTGEIPDWLPGDFHERWIALISEGHKPVFGCNHHGFYLKRPMGERQEPHSTAEEPVSDAREEFAPKASAAPAAKRVLVLRPFIPFDPATLPPREWLYGRHYQRRTVSLTAGPGGMGKSSLVLVEAIAMATARNLLGEQPTERLRVWLHNGEDPLEEINRRVAAICLHHSISQEELRGQLWITSGKEFPLRVANGYSNLKIDTVLVRQISTAIRENQIDVADFDPLVTLHSVSEGDPGKMDAVIRIFADLADEHDASIELNHHVRKPAAGTEADHDVFDIRGVMAISDATRAARVLNRMNKADAENVGISDAERQSYFRVDRAKGNYSLAQASVWRRFVEVTLPNPTADQVGVVEAWDFPGQGTATPEKAAADQRAEKVFLQLLDKFLARGVNVSASSGPNFAPAKFASEREAAAAKVSKAMLKAAMTRLLDAGRIRSEPTGRSDRNSYRLVPRQ